MLSVGEPFPRFVAQACMGLNDDDIATLSSNDLIGKWQVFFFYPKDFTFVCPSELHAFQAKLDEFKAKGVEVVACSTDTPESHWGWLQVDKNNGGIKGVTYPLVADQTKTITENFGILFGDYFINENDELEADGPMIAFRGLFLIDKEGIVQHQIVNNLPLGRNVDEALRMVDALQHHEEEGEVCPANWEKGKDAMKENFAGVADYLSKH